LHSKLPSAHKINHLVQILRVHLRLVVRVAGRLRRTLSENVAPQRGATTAFLGTTETLTESIKRSGSTQTNVASSLRAHLPRKCVTPYLKDGTFLEDIDIRLFLRVPLHKKSRRRADALAGSCASSLGDSRRPRRRGTPGARSQRVRASKTSPKILQNNKVSYPVLSPRSVGEFVRYGRRRGSNFRTIFAFECVHFEVVGAPLRCLETLSKHKASVHGFLARSNRPKPSLSPP
jgi:hypothetical protein